MLGLGFAMRFTSSVELGALSVALALSTFVTSGCESCSFTFGAREIRVRLHVPVGYEDAEVSFRGQGGMVEPVAPGITDFFLHSLSESDGPVKCQYPGGIIEVSHPGCEAQSVSVETLPSNSDTRREEPLELELFLQCEPSDAGGEPGWWCDKDGDCGGDGFTCHPELDLCLAPTCTTDSDCGAVGVLRCNLDTGSCAPF